MELLMARLDIFMKAAFVRIGQFTHDHPRLTTAFKFGTVFGLFWLVGWQRLDPDFGWHLQAGNYISSHGIPNHDVFSYTASQFRWINHEWGYDVILANLYNLPHGWFILTTIFAGLWTTALAIADRKASAFVLLVTTFAVGPYAGNRPTIITIIFFVLLLKLSHRESLRIKLLIPLLFIIWANLHGGLIIGLLALIYFAFRDRNIAWVWVLIASILATFINPYGPRLYIEIIRTLTDSSVHLQIKEWNYFTVHTPSRPYVALWLFGFWLYGKDTVWAWLKRLLRRPSTKTPVGDNLIGPIMLMLAMSATRNLPLFVIATVKDLSTYTQKEKALIRSVKLNKISIGILSVFVLGVVFWVFVSVRESYAPVSSVRGSGYPTAAINYLAANGCDNGNLFNSYDYGGYLVWKLPAQKIYIDGRMPVWRDADGQRYMDRYFKIYKDKDYQRAQFKKYNIRCVLVQGDSDNKKLLKWLKEAGWQTIEHRGTGVLVVAPRSSD